MLASSTATQHSQPGVNVHRPTQHVLLLKPATGRQNLT